jgi:hypothetical protein
VAFLQHVKEDKRQQEVYIGNMRNVEIIFVLLIALSMVDEILTASTTHLILSNRHQAWSRNCNGGDYGFHDFRVA